MINLRKNVSGQNGCHFEMLFKIGFKKRSVFRWIRNLNGWTPHLQKMKLFIFCAVYCIGIVIILFFNYTRQKKFFFLKIVSRVKMKTVIFWKLKLEIWKYLGDLVYIKVGVVYWILAAIYFVQCETSYVRFVIFLICVRGWDLTTLNEIKQDMFL